MLSQSPPHTDLPEQLVNEPGDLAACCDHLATTTVFGFDTEFVGEDSYHPHLCLVQVATEERLYLIDPLTVGPLDRFWQLVVDPARQVVVHAGREEVRLCRQFAGQLPGNLFDLQIAAGLVGLVYPLGHGGLVQQLLDVQLDKGETRTEWRHRPLTRQQVRYAFDDVRYLLPLWRRLTTELHQLHRLDWAREEFARLAVAAAPEEVAPDKWRKLRGIGSLDRARLAMVRELFRWREEMAAQLNRPARTLIRDDLLIEIARRNPRKPRDLEMIRGLPKRNLEAIVQAIDRARAQPADQWPAVKPRDNDPPQFALVTSVLGAVLGDFCVRQRLAPNLVASASDLKQLVRGHGQEGGGLEDSLLGQGWRRERVLPELRAVLEGRRAVRIGDPLADAPLALEDLRG